MSNHTETLLNITSVCSLSQVVVTILDLFHANPHLAESTKVFVYDDGCHAHGFMQQPERAILWAGQPAWKTLMKKKFCVDRFHMDNHTDPWCKEHMPSDREEIAHLMKGEATEDGKPAWSVNTQVRKSRFTRIQTTTHVVTKSLVGSTHV